jgi:DeoR/GlpR family transcriptional regulator of sugar metabolism
MSDLDSLAQELDVSLSTVRRDVELLASRGLVQRTHGGVIWTAASSDVGRPYAFDQRLEYESDAKRRIALAARGLVDPHDTILIDGGTTTHYFAQQLIGMPLQIVTNSLPIADLFTNDDRVELIVSGGLLYPRYGVLLGPMAEHVLGTIHVKTLFLSVAGINEGVLYNQNLLLVSAQRRMIEQAQRVVLLADSGKFEQQALARLCDLSEIDVVVGDEQIARKAAEQVRAAGCELMIAE